MQLTGYNTFEFIYRVYSNGISGSIAAAVDRALSAAQVPLNAMLVIFVATLGYATISGRMNYNDGVNRILRMCFVVLFVTSAATYGEYVVSFFTIGLPDFFAQHIAGAPAGADPGASFDVIMTKMWLDSTAVWKEAPWGFKTVYDGILIIASLAIVACSLVLMFAVFLVVQTLLGVIVAIGPIVILGYLFDYTKKIVDGWIDVLVTLSIITLCVNIVLEVLLNAIRATLNDITLSGSVTNQLAELLGISLVVLVLGASVVILPRIIERIGGAVAAGAGMERARGWLRGEPALRPTASGAGWAASRGTSAAASGVRRVASRVRNRMGA